jgi:hypothetical protein
MPRRKLPQKSGLYLRYYLCTPDGLWRLSARLHKEIIAQTVKLPQYQGTHQKVLEVFVRRRDRFTYFSFRGGVYCFDAAGLLDLHALAEGAVVGMEGSRARTLEANVLDIGPAIRHARWTQERTWKPSPVLRREITADLMGKPVAFSIRDLKVSGK